MKEAKPLFKNDECKILESILSVLHSIHQLRIATNIANKRIRSMEETCPICLKKFPQIFLERHVNSCLDTSSVETEERSTHSPNPEKGKVSNVFAALGLKVDSSKPTEKLKKGGATLTSILLAEKRLRKKLDDLERKAQDRGAIDSVEVIEKDNEPDFQTVQSIGPEQFEKESAEDINEHLDSRNPLQSDFSQRERDNNDVIEETKIRLDASKNIHRNEDYLELKQESELPLAHRLRPSSLDDFFGQEKLAGKDGVIRNFMHSQNIPSFILWGVPGVGKTSLARIVAANSNHRFVELSGTDANAKKLKETFLTAKNERQRTGVKTILFLDEIHRFNRAVQDLLLPAIEKGTVTVIGATTENPSFSLNNALLSRMHTFVMEPLSHESLVRILSKGLLLLNKSRKFIHNLHLMAFSKDALDYIAQVSTGDSRVALNILESVNAYLSGLQFKSIQKTDLENEQMILPEKTGVIKISAAQLKPLLRTKNFQQAYDRKGDNHYDAISAFHKSVRGSDSDAAIFYLVKMLHGGEDPLFIARRMIVIASEDIGLRDSSCLPFAIAALDALQFVGMPEGEIILAHCAIKLARAPKSTKLYRALRNAQALLSENPEIAQIPVPLNLRNAPTLLMKDLGYGAEYKYNPSFKHGLASQRFLPPEVGDLKFVEQTHLGDSVDELVDEHLRDAVNEEVQEYELFKTYRKTQIMQQMLNYRKRNRLKKMLFHDHISSDDNGERLSSYDENLSKDAQPEYFDGTEHDKFSPGIFEVIEQ